MTEGQINAEAFKPSKSWIDAGSHGIGKLYFEVIGCDGLPNMDFGPLQMATGGVLAGKTDSYACIIYEDSIVNTDVIYDSLSPRWMPWTQRAFAFHIMDPSSQLMLAILDYDAVNPLDDDDPIGRVTIDPSNMRPMTDYTMQFDLVTSAVVSNRKTNGTVTVRVRIEWESERKALIKSARHAPEIYVNVLRHRDYLAADYAIVGEVGCTERACNAFSISAVLLIISTPFCSCRPTRMLSTWIHSLHSSMNSKATKTSCPC